MQNRWIMIELSIFRGSVKEDAEKVSVDNTVFILDREYGITQADSERPVLMTAGIRSSLASY